MFKSSLDVEALKSQWLQSGKSFELLATGFEPYWESLTKFKEKQTVPQWEEFVASIRGSDVFGKVYTLAMTDPAIAVAFTLIISTLNAAKPSMSDLNFGLMCVDRILTTNDRQFIRKNMRDNQIDPEDFTSLKQLKP